MFGNLRTDKAILYYNEDAVFDKFGNKTHGLLHEIEIKCSVQSQNQTNKKLTSSNLEFIYSFSVYTDLIENFDFTKNYTIKLLNETNENRIFEVVRFDTFNLLNYMKIYIK